MMDNDKLRKALGLDINERLNASNKAIEKLTSIDKAFNLSSQISKSLSNTNSLMKAVEIANSFGKPKYGWNYLSNPKGQTLLMYDAITEMAEKQNRITDMLGGTTISNIAKFMSNQALLETSKKNLTERVIEGMMATVTQNSKAYNSYLSTSENLAKALNASHTIEKAFANTNLFTSQNFIENKKLNPFDILSGAAFTNIAKMYGKDYGTINLEEEISEINNELFGNEEMKKETEAFFTNINSVSKNNYKKFDEYVTDWIHSITSKFGWSKQRAYFVAAILIFIAGVYGKDFISAFNRKEPSITNNITVNNNYSFNKIVKKIDIVFRQATVYPKNLSSTRKLGIIKENTEIEILETKTGWCFVRAEIEIIKKEGKKKIKITKLMNGWIQQIYIQSFQ